MSAVQVRYQRAIAGNFITYQCQHEGVVYGKLLKIVVAEKACGHKRILLLVQRCKFSNLGDDQHQHNIPTLCPMVASCEYIESEEWIPIDAFVRPCVEIAGYINVYQL